MYILICHGVIFSYEQIEERSIKLSSNFLSFLKLKTNSHFRHINHSEISDQSECCKNEIIIVMTLYCPTLQHLLHMQNGVNLLSFKTFGQSKCPGT